MTMVQAASLGSAITVKVAFLTLPSSTDLRSQALPYEKTTAVQRFGVGGSSPRVYSFGPLFHSVGLGFWQLGLLGTIILPIFMGLAGYSAMETANSGNVGVLPNKPMETGRVESPGRLP
ncbi:hypothetical protein Pyn_13720 [Prunus yedoensis var. nudiflora]|uniref:Uncharacterized protein n=1 Tax=Prunus yedoensis var. nudiflora TaxID=2094558 RepID=A0A314UHC8_PRUYE|nr:hypothetical protein Pyn_13720 [Prunus yedoensis var. nudiflora]